MSDEVGEGRPKDTNEAVQNRLNSFLGGRIAPLLNQKEKSLQDRAKEAVDAKEQKEEK